MEFVASGCTVTRTDIVVGCVADDNPKYLSQALRLLKSVRWFGGSISSAPFIVCVIGRADDAYRKAFEAYGASVKVVPQFHARSLVANKIRFLELDEIRAFKKVLLLDCDTVVVQDPGNYLSEDVFSAKIADLPTMPHDIFKKLFEHYRLPIPPQTFECTVRGEPTIPYFNTGVLLFPRSALETLVKEWIVMTRSLIENMEIIAGREHFVEQTSMTLALVSSGENLKALGNNMNFPAHLDDTGDFERLHNVDPVIIHYHWACEGDGCLSASRYPLVNKRIARFNERLRDERKLNSHQIEGLKESSGIPVTGEHISAGIRKPIFVAGTMRSGTTLLADLLGSADEIVNCPFELKDLWSKAGVPNASPKTRENYCPELGSHDVREGQRKKLTDEFIKRMSAAGCSNPEEAFFLNKNPHLCNKLPLVDALFPDARFIWIYRQMPSVVASLKCLFEDVNQRQQTWHYWPEPRPGTMNRCWSAFHFKLPEGIDMRRCFPGGDVRYLAEYWFESNRAVSAFFRDLPVERGFTLSEESLIENPGPEISRCLAFLGLRPSSFPGDNVKMDPQRNGLWEKRLTVGELESLLDFVNDKALAIDEIFGRERPAEKYLAEMGRIFVKGRL